MAGGGRKGCLFFPWRNENETRVPRGLRSPANLISRTIVTSSSVKSLNRHRNLVPLLFWPILLEKPRQYGIDGYYFANNEFRILWEKGFCIEELKRKREILHSYDISFQFESFETNYTIHELYKILIKRRVEEERLKFSDKKKLSYNLNYFIWNIRAMIRCLLFMGILQNLDKQEKKVWTYVALSFEFLSNRNIDVHNYSWRLFYIMFHNIAIKGVYE